MSPDTNHKSKNLEFSQRLDFYWQYIAVYSVILLIYGLLKGTIKEFTIRLVLYDPIVILLGLFIMASALSMLFNYYRQKKIIIGPDFIIFKTRLREKKFLAKDITHISVGREKLIKVRRGAFRIIKIKLANRKRILRIRPSSFYEEDELVASFTRFKRRISTAN
jgi:hypothetical protein